MLIIEQSGSVLSVRLNRPQVRNAFNHELIEALHHALDKVPEGVRVLVLSGEGEAFCAGGDLNWMREASTYSQIENYADALRLAALFQAIADAPVPVIARVQGGCFGGGCGLVAAADIAIADEKAKFAFSEVKLGLVPATISRFVTPKIGPGQARALYTTGEVFDSARALRIGLVHEVTTDLDVAVAAKVRAVLAAGPDAVHRAKNLARYTPPTNEAAAQLLAEVRASDEAKEGISAFLEKRRATYFEEPV